MNGWYSKALGDGLLAAESLHQIEQRLRPRCVDDKAAVFIRETSEGLQCEITVYFSPALSAVAESIGAVPCAPPSRAGLSLLIGVDASWSALFPERAS